MALKAALCTQCGAGIQVDDTKEAGICPQCGTAFITEKVINNYITNTVTNNQYNTVQNINKTIIGREKTEAEEYVQAGDVFLSLGDEDEAEESYRKAIKANPAYYKGWLGLFKLDCESSLFLYNPEPYDSDVAKYKKELEEYEYRSILPQSRFSDPIDVINLSLEKHFEYIDTKVKEGKSKKYRLDNDNYIKAMATANDEQKKDVEEVGEYYYKVYSEKAAAIEAKFLRLKEEYKKIKAEKEKIFQDKLDTLKGKYVIDQDIANNEAKKKKLLYNKKTKICIIVMSILTVLTLAWTISWLFIQISRLGSEPFVLDYNRALPMVMPMSVYTAVMAVLSIRPKQNFAGYLFGIFIGALFLTWIPAFFVTSIEAFVIVPAAVAYIASVALVIIFKDNFRKQQ